MSGQRHHRRENRPDPCHHTDELAVVDGLRVAVILGRLRPEEAASLARAHVARIALPAPR